MTGYITATDVAHIYKISLNHVYVLACTRRWGRYRDGQGRVHYRLDHVADTLASQDATTPQIML
jgi:hypothetical protein